MKNKKKILSLSQKKRFTQWEVPHLIKLLKKEHRLTTAYLKPDFASFTKRSFVFEGKTFFPLFLEENFLGFLVCFQILNPFQIQTVEAFIKAPLRKGPPRLPFGRAKEASPFFPFLVESQPEEKLLKIAYQLYLKSSCFAFLRVEDLEWKDNIFQELKGVFLCIPAFHSLSVFQKKIFLRALREKKLSGPVVLGVRKKNSLSPQYHKLFQVFS